MCHGGISQTYSPTNRAATKHVDVADHYVREQVERRRITVNYVKTTDMDAGIFTKPLEQSAFLKHRAKLLSACPF